MKFFSGFCVDIDKKFFKEFLQESELCIAGFSYGAQKAVEYALNSNQRIDKIQLLSPAFFNYNKKIINLNIKAFKKNKNEYIKNFLTKAGISKWKMENGKCEQSEPLPYTQFIELDVGQAIHEVCDGENGELRRNEIKITKCNEEDLYKLFTFDWSKIKLLKNIQIEVFLGECDKIISVRKAYEFFRNYADVYLIKKANHFLRG